MVSDDARQSLQCSIIRFRTTMRCGYLSVGLALLTYVHRVVVVYMHKHIQ